MDRFAACIGALRAALPRIVLGGAIAATTSLLLAGCGGGGYDDGGPGLSPEDAAAGFYDGRTASGRSLSVIVLETGRIYALYGPVGNPGSSEIEGVMAGDGTAYGSTFSSNGLIDVNFANQTATPVALSATFGYSAYFDANLAYLGGGSDSFRSDYSRAYEYIPSVPGIAASYSGQLASATRGVDDAVLSISPSGAVSLSSSGGCLGAGTIYAHPVGNVYDLTISYGGGCPAAGRTLTGHARYDGVARSLVGITTSPALDRVSLFVGSRL